MEKDSLLLPALSGLLLCLSFPDWSLFPFAWFAIAPYIFFLLQNVSWKRVLTGHFLFGASYFGGCLYWILRVLQVFGGLGVAEAAFVFGLLLVLLTVVILPVPIVTHSVARRSSRAALLICPAVWIAIEAARDFVPFGGFPWASVGYSQIPFLTVLQIADIGGVYLVSFVILLVNCAVVALLLRKLRGLSYAALFAFVIANVYGYYRLTLWEPESFQAIRVGRVQPNIELAQNREYYAAEYFEELPRKYVEAVAGGASLVILPEAQNPYFYPENFYFKNFWEELVREYGIAVLFNSASSADSTLRSYFNSVHLINFKGEGIFQYNKVRLVPFGEYLPLSDWLGFAEALVAEVSSFEAGSEQNLGEVNGVSFGVMICYEAIFPDMGRSLAEKGAQFLVNVTNDAWFGRTSAPTQHLQMATLRSVETRRSLVRVANSGISGIVTPKGRVLDETGLFVETVSVSDVPLYDGTTLFVAVGNWINFGLILFCLLLSLLFLVQKEKGVKASA